MNDIRNIQPGSYSTPGTNTNTSTNANPGATLPDLGTLGAGALSGIDTSTMLQEMSHLIRTIKDPMPGGTPGVSNAQGAPLIDGVQIDFSPEDLAAALLVLQGKTQEAQMSTAREGLVTNKKKMEDQNQRAMDKIKEWIKKCEEASAKERALGPFAWIAKIIAVIAAAILAAVAAAATALTGGAAAPLLVLAAMAMAGAVMSLASQISQSAGGPSLEISTLITKLCTKMLEAFGVPKEQLEAASKVMAGVLGFLSGVTLADPALLGNMVGGIAELAGADPMVAAILSGIITAVVTIVTAIAMAVLTGGASLAGAASSLAKTIQTAGQIGQSITGVIGGVSSTVAGGLQIGKAVDQRDASRAQADKKMVDALIAKLQKQMEDDREDIKKVLDEIMEGINIVSQMINSAGQSRSQIASNLGGKNQPI